MARPKTSHDPTWLRARVTQAMEEVIVDTLFEITASKVQKAIDWFCENDGYKALRPNGNAQGNDKSFVFNDNITRFAELIGVSREEVINAALKQPSIFVEDPERLYGNYLALQRLRPFVSQGRGENKRLVTTSEFLQQALTNSLVFSISVLNTHLRYVAAQVEVKFEQKPLQGLGNFFSGNSRGKQVDVNAVVTHYADKYHRQSKGASTIACMIARGGIEQGHWEKAKTANVLSADFIVAVEERVEIYRANYQKNFGDAADEYEQKMKALKKATGIETVEQRRKEGSSKTKALMTSAQWQELSIEQRQHVNNIYRLTTPTSERFPPQEHLLHLNPPQTA